MRDALIDLGEVPADGAAGPETALPRPPLPYRWVLGLVTVVLVALLGGGGPPPQPPPAPVVLPAGLGDQIKIDLDRLYLIGQVEPIGRVMRSYLIQAYDLPAVTPAGSYRFTAPGEIFDIYRAGDLLLVGYSDIQSGASGLVALRPGGGDPLWKRSASVYGLSSDRSLLLLHEESLPGRSESREFWRAVDPATGAVLWSVEQPEDGMVAMSAGFYRPGRPIRFFTVHGDGLVEARDGHTGKVTASTRLPRPPGDGFVALPAGGLLMVGYGADETIAYDEQTLTQRWRRDGEVPLGDGYPRDCGPMICLVGYEVGVTVVDPATGREAWHDGGYDTAEVIGDRVLVGSVNRADPVLAVLEPWTGRSTAVAGSWVSGGPGPEPGTAWVYRHQTVGYTLRFGILRLADGKVHPRGQAERMAGDCRFATHAVVCRQLDSSIVIWRV